MTLWHYCILNYLCSRSLLYKLPSVSSILSKASSIRLSLQRYHVHLQGTSARDVCCPRSSRHDQGMSPCIRLSNCRFKCTLKIYIAYTYKAIQLSRNVRLRMQSVQSCHQSKRWHFWRIYNLKYIVLSIFFLCHIILYVVLHSFDLSSI